MDDLVGLETVQPFNCADDLVRTHELVRLSSFFHLPQELDGNYIQLMRLARTWEVMWEYVLVQ